MVQRQKRTGPRTGIIHAGSKVQENAVTVVSGICELENLTKNYSSLHFVLWERNEMTRMKNNS
jgi:hypothetical protein